MAESCLPFFQKLDRVLFEILRGGLKEDRDDTLHEKLLSFISTKASNTAEHFLTDLLKATKVEAYISNALMKMPADSRDPDDINDRVAFALRLLAIFLAHEHIFILFQSKRQNIDIMNAVELLGQGEIETLNLSTKDALLSCLTNIAGHMSGGYWIKRNGCTEVGLSYLKDDASSIYVQNASIKFLATCLQNQSFEDDDEPSSEDHVPDSFLCSIIEKLKFHASDEAGSGSSVFCKYVSVLKMAIENKPEIGIIAEQHHLISFLKELIAENAPVNLDKLIDFLALILMVQKSIDYATVSDFVTCLNKQKRLDAAVSLSAKLLVSKALKDDENSNLLSLVLTPIKMITQDNSLDSTDDTVIYKECLNDKKEGRKLILTCLSSLNQIIPAASPSNLRTIILLLDKLMYLVTHQEKINLQCLAIVTFPKIQCAVMQAMSQILSCNDSLLLNEQEILHILDTFLSLIDNSSSVSCNVLNCVIKSCAPLMSSWCKIKGKSQMELDSVPQLCNLGLALQKRCLDTRWEVVDSVYETLQNLLVEMQEYNAFMEWLCTYRFHMLAWHCLKMTTNEGFVRATAIQLLAHTLQIPFLRRKFLEELSWTEEHLIAFLLSVLKSDCDTFVRREVPSILASFHSEFNKQLSVEKAICSVFYHVIVHDLDWEVKLRVLRTWKDIVYKYHLKCTPGNGETWKDNTDEILKNLCESGFSGALIESLSDPDSTVRSEAWNILKEVQNTLEDMGLVIPSKDPPPPVSSDCVPPKDMEMASCDNDFGHSEDIDNLDRDSVIESVLDMRTYECIENTMHSNEIDIGKEYRIDDFILPVPETNACDFLFKLKTLQRDQFTDQGNVVNGIYEENPESLLDDILSAVSLFDNTTNDKFIKQLIDCY